MGGNQRIHGVVHKVARLLLGSCGLAIVGGVGSGILLKSFAGGDSMLNSWLVWPLTFLVLLGIPLLPLPLVLLNDVRRKRADGRSISRSARQVFILALVFLSGAALTYLAGFLLLSKAGMDLINRVIRIDHKSLTIVLWVPLHGMGLCGVVGLVYAAILRGIASLAKRDAELSTGDGTVEVPQDVP
jgi:hypothetical protein